MLRPSVNRVVRLLDDDRAGNSVRFELMERVCDDRGFALNRRVLHCLPNHDFLFQGFMVATIEFDQQMGAERWLFSKPGRKALLVMSQPLAKGFFVLAVNESPSRVILNLRWWW